MNETKTNEVLLKIKDIELKKRLYSIKTFLYFNILAIS